MVKKNFVIQFIYQFVILVLPLIISPYLTRVLGATNLGIYAYDYSIAYYFVIFANLGIVTYGTRAISKNKNNIEMLRKIFWEIFFLHLLFALVSTIFYFLFLFLTGSLFDIQKIVFAIMIFSCLFDVTWLFQGLEMFLKIALRNVIIKVLEISMIFLFVKNKNDLSLYIFIIAFSICLSYLSLIPSAIKTIGFKKVLFSNLFIHIKPVFILGLGSISVAIYTVLDKTVIGLFCPSSDVAFYDYSEKIIKIFISILASLGTVMVPYSTKLLTEKKNEEIFENINKSTIFISFLSCSFLFGLSLISDIVIPLYYGEEFAVCAKYVVFLSPVILIIPLGDVYRSEFIIPNGNDNFLLFTLIANALLNLVFNFVLVPFYGVIGAIISTLFSELVGLILQYCFVSKQINVWKSILNIFPFIIIGLSMYFMLIFIKIDNVIGTICVRVLIGFVYYLTLSFLYFFIFKRKLFLNFVSLIKKHFQKGEKL